MRYCNCIEWQVVFSKINCWILWNLHYLAVQKQKATIIKIDNAINATHEKLIKKSKRKRLNWLNKQKIESKQWLHLWHWCNPLPKVDHLLLPRRADVYQHHVTHPQCPWILIKAALESIFAHKKKNEIWWPLVRHRWIPSFVSTLKFYASVTVFDKSFEVRRGTYGSVFVRADKETISTVEHDLAHLPFLFDLVIDKGKPTQNKKIIFWAGWSTDKLEKLGLSCKLYVVFS